MKCPKCKYVSFEHLNRCRKCGIDLIPVKAEARIDFPHSLRLGLLSRSNADTAPEQTQQLIGQDEEMEVSEIGGRDFNGVASAELGTGGYRSVEDNSAGEITLEQEGYEKEAEPQPDESPPSEMHKEDDGREEVAFDSASIEGLGEDTSDNGNTDKKPDDDLVNLSLEVEEIEDTIEEEIDAVMSTPHTIDRQEPEDDDGTGNLEVSDLSLDKPAGDRPEDAPDGADVVELDIGDDELEIVSKGTKKGKKEMGEHQGLDLDDLDLTLNEEEEEKGGGEDIDDMDIDLDDSDIGGLNRDGK